MFITVSQVWRELSNSFNIVILQLQNGQWRSRVSVEYTNDSRRIMSLQQLQTYNGSGIQKSPNFISRRRNFVTKIRPIYGYRRWNKKAQLSLTNPRDAKACQNRSNSTCLQRCRWQYWPIFIGLAVVASEICGIPRNWRKIQTYGVQGHPRSSILLSIESPYMTSYWSLIVTLAYLLPFSRYWRLKLENRWISTPLPYLSPLAAERH